MSVGSDPPRPGVALALSGGGHPAALFHLGALWRLNELGLLRAIDRISVSGGGALPAARLVADWAVLDFDLAAVALAFEARVAGPIRALAGTPIATTTAAGARPEAATPADETAFALRDRLFDDLTLADLPARPRLVLHLGGFDGSAPGADAIPLAEAVARCVRRASGTDPLRLEVFGGDVGAPRRIADREGVRSPESPWPIHYAVLAGHAGADPDAEVRDAIEAGGRRGAHWSMEGSEPDVPESLEPVDSLRQQRLVNRGYAASDAALRDRYDPELPPPEGVPYPEIPL